MELLRAAFLCSDLIRNREPDEGEFATNPVVRLQFESKILTVFQRLFSRLINSVVSCEAG